MKEETLAQIHRVLAIQYAFERSGDPEVTVTPMDYFKTREKARKRWMNRGITDVELSGYRSGASPWL